VGRGGRCRRRDTYGVSFPRTALVPVRASPVPSVVRGSSVVKFFSSMSTPPRRRRSSRRASPPPPPPRRSLAKHAAARPAPRPPQGAVVTVHFSIRDSTATHRENSHQITDNRPELPSRLALRTVPHTGFTRRRGKAAARPRRRCCSPRRPLRCTAPPPPIATARRCGRGRGRSARRRRRRARAGRKRRLPTER